MLNRKDDLQKRLETFYLRNERYKSLGFDRFLVAKSLLELVDNIKSPALDIGTGKGLFSIALAQKGVEVISIDTDSDEIALATVIAEKYLVRINFIQNDASNIKYENNYFGFVGMMDALHHLEKPNAVLAEMVRVLNFTGKIFIADFDHNGFKLVESVHLEEGRIHHRNTLTVGWAHEVLTKIGLKCILKTNMLLHDIVIFEKCLK